MNSEPATAATVTVPDCEGCGEPLERDGSVYVCHGCQRAWATTYYDGCECCE